MSEHEEQETSGPGEADAAKDAGHTSPDERLPESSTGGGSVQRNRLGVVAWLALLLAAGAVALASQPYWPSWVGGWSDQAAGPASPTVEEFRSLTDRVDQADRAGEQAIQELQELRRTVADLEAELAAGLEAATAPPVDLAQRLERLETRIEGLQGEHNSSLGAIRSRLEDLEEQVGRRLEQFEMRLDDVGLATDRAASDLATRLRLIEVDSLFALAQDQLAVSTNVDGARSAWQRGLERLAGLEGPEFADLKRAARREFEQLRAFEEPDTRARLERIHAIVSDIDEWPAAADRAQSQGSSGVSSTGWRGRLGSLFDELVRIESVDGEDLSPAQFELVRARVQATLQSAALALVRSDHDAAGGLIERALEDAGHAFDTEAPGVAEAIAWLADLAAQSGSEPRPPSMEDSRAEIARLVESL